jgi:hypothetical protein
MLLKLGPQATKLFPKVGVRTDIFRYDGTDDVKFEDVIGIQT